ncbi:metalloregulator ArsR/SmtB family transcription factor [Ferrovum sp.]|uniref:ArsR/SmtB family transcription factor n=1 Tax=Ferrovum sp. TaxID=2609467 RepID=UPI00262A7538|nr:metalloregulator ArsR/SmtB family transcription factor [Ferrovum sp.]
MDDGRKTKDLLYEQVARIGKAVSSPKRLELIELLSQSEKTVDTLSREASISMKLASAHLRELRNAQLVETDRRGKNIVYRLASKAVVDLWVDIHTLAENRLVELQMALQRIATEPNDLVPSDRETLMKMARRGEVVVLDVRPAEEYLAKHLPFARSIPLDELRHRLAELPRDRLIVAYCRGPYCLMAKDAVELLRNEGFDSAHLRDGVPEWEAAISR